MRIGLNGEDSFNTFHIFYLPIIAVGQAATSGKVVSRGFVQRASAADLKSFSATI
jgi:hypothetical protein